VLIDEFFSLLQECRVCVLATSSIDAEPPGAAPCFFAWQRDPLVLFVASDAHTRHIRQGLRQQEMAGAAYVEGQPIAALRGVQFRGRLGPVTDRAAAKAVYLQRFPEAEAWLGATALWGLELNWLKWTDNRRGFGFKQRARFTDGVWVT
jgi:hypothetical protein